MTSIIMNVNGRGGNYGKMIELKAGVQYDGLDPELVDVLVKGGLAKEVKTAVTQELPDFLTPEKISKKEKK